MRCAALHAPIDSAVGAEVGSAALGIDVEVAAGTAVGAVDVGASLSGTGVGVLVHAANNKVSALIGKIRVFIVCVSLCCWDCTKILSCLKGALRCGIIQDDLT